VGGSHRGLVGAGSMNDDVTHRHDQYAGGGSVFVLCVFIALALLFSLRMTYNTNCRLSAFERGAEGSAAVGIWDWSCTLKFSDGHALRLDDKDVWP
jgi:hypothetical protein